MSIGVPRQADLVLGVIHLSNTVEIGNHAPPSVPVEHFRAVAGHLLGGVTVVTTESGGQLFGVTASSVTSLSLEPPMMLVCLQHASRTADAVARSGVFAINVLRDDQTSVALRFAGRGEDKFAHQDVSLGITGAPLLENAIAQMECEVTQVVDAGTHGVVFGRVTQANAVSGSPLMYFRGNLGARAFT